MSASAVIVQPIPARATPAQVRVGRLLSLLATHMVLLAGAAFVLLPFVWMLMTSLKSPGEIFSADFTLWPRKFSAVENYQDPVPGAGCEL
jgi:multiple sugar transport system permease protein